ncbi:hypothetical protein [Pedobacter panaciterrae]
MEKLEEIKNALNDWKNANIQFLPLNIDEWKISVNAESLNSKVNRHLEFGKYNASLVRSTPFYKAFSRLYKPSLK